MIDEIVFAIQLDIYSILSSNFECLNIWAMSQIKFMLSTLMKHFNFHNLSVR